MRKITRPAQTTSRLKRHGVALQVHFDSRPLHKLPYARQRKEILNEVKRQIQLDFYQTELDFDSSGHPFCKIDITTFSLFIRLCAFILFGVVFSLERELACHVACSSQSLELPTLYFCQLLRRRRASSSLFL